MKTIVQLVDTIDYVNRNCFQHQLTHALQKQCEVVQIELSQLYHSSLIKADGYISCLRQRTLMRNVSIISQWLRNSKLVVYDQDPWQAFMDDSQYKGAYEQIIKHINVKSFAVTTELWADFLNAKGIPAKFVNMWVLPEYCTSGPAYEDRTINTGFIGTVHNYRKELFDKLYDLGSPVNVSAGNVLDYHNYLKALQNIRVFIHSEDAPLAVDKKQMNLKDGLWIKDIEAASQGCFSIRNVGEGYLSYAGDLPHDDDGNRLIMQFEKPENVLQKLDIIQKMNPNKRQSLIERTVEYIRASNKWQETATTLVSIAAS